MAFKPLSKNNGDETRIRFENVGDSLEGYYLGSEKFDYKGDSITKQLFQNDDEETISVIGGSTLNQDLANVERGTRVRVTYQGKQKSAKGRTFNKYEVMVDDEDKIAV